MKPRTFLLTAALVAFLAACSSSKPFVYGDHHADFLAMAKTGWLQPYDGHAEFLKRAKAGW